MNWHRFIPVFFVLFGLVGAQSKQRLLLGPTQSFGNSSFCKQYKCKLLSDASAFNKDTFLLTLPNDTETPAELEKIKRTHNLNDSQLFRKYRNTLWIERDKKNQVGYMRLKIREKTLNSSIVQSESNMIDDLIYFAVGKKYPREVSLGEKYTPFYSTCFSLASALPQEKISDGFLALTGTTTFEAEKKTRKYAVTCYEDAHGETSGDRLPELEITTK